MAKKIILGLTVPITIVGSTGTEQKVIARVDTGATASSIDIGLASELKLGPVVRSKVVKSASGIKKRPVVRVKIKINGSTMDEEFSLADRGHMTYEVLLGQNILKKGQFLVDPHKEYKE